MKPPKTNAEKKAAAFLEVRAPQVIKRSSKHEDAVDLLIAELARRMPAVTGARVPATNPGTRLGRTLIGA